MTVTAVVTRHLVYVIGEPGVGKTSAVREALGAPDLIIDKPIRHQEHRINDVQWIQLGGRSSKPEFAGVFDGTDVLAMDASPKALDLIRTGGWRYMLGEGDRLGSKKFFTGVQDMGIQLHVLYLFAPPGIIEARRVARGGGQNATWLQGRKTKIQNLVQDVTFPVQAISTQDLTATQVGRELRRKLVAIQDPQ